MPMGAALRISLKAGQARMLSIARLISASWSKFKFSGRVAVASSPRFASAADEAAFALTFAFAPFLGGMTNQR